MSWKSKRSAALARPSYQATSFDDALAANCRTDNTSFFSASGKCWKGGFSLSLLCHVLTSILRYCTRCLKTRRAARLPTASLRFCCSAVLLLPLPTPPSPPPLPLILDKNRGGNFVHLANPERFARCSAEGQIPPAFPARCWHRRIGLDTRRPAAMLAARN
jgi:hypothetical protein